LNPSQSASASAKKVPRAAVEHQHARYCLQDLTPTSSSIRPLQKQEQRDQQQAPHTAGLTAWWGSKVAHGMA
jgi:hypothetical protein